MTYDRYGSPIPAAQWTAAALNGRAIAIPPPRPRTCACCVQREMVAERARRDAGGGA